MANLFALLLAIFAGVALLAWSLERFGKPAEPQKVEKLTRWIYPLVGLLLVLTALRYFLGW